MSIEEREQLIKQAMVVASNAYAPYSNYRVGAALLDAAGGVHLGCNVENASYGLTLCAERNALAVAVAEGMRSFTALAIVSDGARWPWPCGACRQVLAEFCSPELEIYTANIDDPEQYRMNSLGTLLPFAFGS